jgi:hypothetical protein
VDAIDALIKLLETNQWKFLLCGAPPSRFSAHPRQVGLPASLPAEMRRMRVVSPRRLTVLLVALVILAAVVPAVALAAARAAPTITYKGKTDGRSDVTVKVRDGRVTSFKASVYASCGTSNLLITIAYPPVGRRGTSAAIRGGAFRATYQSDPDLEPQDDRRTIAGRLGRSGALTGTIRVRGLCTADATYSASRR